MNTGKNESKILPKDISCECKCKFDTRKCNSNQNWNNDKCPCRCEKHHICEKDYIHILLHVVVKIINIWKVLLTIQGLCLMKS